MKKITYSLVLTMFATSAILTSCNSSAEKVDEAKVNIENAAHNLDQAKEDYKDEYNKLKIESEKQTIENDKAIAELKEHSKKMKKEEKEENDKVINELERKNEVMKAKINAYKEDGNEKWQSFKREFNHDMNELGQALKDLTKNNSN